jgi:DNA-binding PadR family transcriptional regulator
VRSAVLALLSEQPMHGYQIIQEIGRRSGGSWRPSPGSVYPTLQQLVDEGLATQPSGPGKGDYELTEEGRAYAAEHEEVIAGVFAQPADASMKHAAPSWMRRRQSNRSASAPNGIANSSCGTQWLMTANPASTGDSNSCHMTK